MQGNKILYKYYINKYSIFLFISFLIFITIYLIYNITYLNKVEAQTTSTSSNSLQVYVYIFNVDYTNTQTESDELEKFLTAENISLPCYYSMYWNGNILNGTYTNNDNILDGNSVGICVFKPTDSMFSGLTQNNIIKYLNNINYLTGVGLSDIHIENANYTLNNDNTISMFYTDSINYKNMIFMRLSGNIKNESNPIPPKININKLSVSYNENNSVVLDVAFKSIDNTFLYNNVYLHTTNCSINSNTWISKYVSNNVIPANNSAEISTSFSPPKHVNECKFYISGEGGDVKNTYFEILFNNNTNSISSKIIN